MNKYLDNNIEENNPFEGEIDEKNLPVRLLNIVIMSGIVSKQTPYKSTVTLKSGDTIDKIQFNLRCCGNNLNVVNTEIMVEIFGTKAVSEFEKLLESQPRSRFITVTGSLFPIRGAALINDLAEKFFINAKQINIESYTINSQTFELEKTEADEKNSEDNPWGV